MNINERNGNKNLPLETMEAVGDQPESLPRPSLRIPSENETIEGDLREEEEANTFATRADLASKPRVERDKMITLGGGLLVAVIFFAFTAIVGRSPAKKKPENRSQQAAEPTTSHPKGSVTPLMDAVRKPSADNPDGQLGPGDIKRTQTPDSSATTPPPPMANERTTRQHPGPAGSLASVPSFSDTQQRWEEPRPYGGPAEPIPAATQQQQNMLKEPSLVFVRSQTQSQASANLNQVQNAGDPPVLEMTPGARILAKLQTEISSADPTPVVAVIEYTYAIGDQVIIPAGALIFGQVTHADRSGYVGVKFDEIQLADGRKEKIDAVGRALDLGPIKGTVTGNNTGKNFAIRAASGIGSFAATLVGNNASASFSEEDLLRERIAQNIGNAGDSELLSLNTNSNIIVSVPAERKIYVVFTKHERTPATLRKISSPAQ
jgi:hypothetical protein